MRAPVLLALLALMLLGQLSVGAPAAAAEGAAPLPTWTTGDRWSYDKTGGAAPGTVERRIAGTFFGALTEHRFVNESGTHPTAGAVESRTAQAIRFRPSDLATLSLRSRATVTAEGADEPFVERSANVTYVPALALLRFPLRVGDAWVAEAREFVEQPGHADTERRVRFEATVVRAETVRVAAGTFPAFVVRLDDRSDGAEPGSGEVLWWAPAACAAARHEFTQGGAAVATHVLAEFRCAEPGDAAGPEAPGAPRTRTLPSTPVALAGVAGAAGAVAALAWAAARGDRRRRR